MDIFTQKKILIQFVILLTVLNLSLIGFLFWKDFLHKPPRQNNQSNTQNNRREVNNHDISEILKRELNLSKEQVDQIRNLRLSFSESEKALSEAIKNEKDSMNLIMFNKDTNDQLVMSLARRVAENNFNLEMQRFEQAQKFKNICTPVQLEKFEGLVLEIRDFFRTDGKPKKKQN
jgi:Spy/CpxP family protein refolding chaperone